MNVHTFKQAAYEFVGSLGIIAIGLSTLQEKWGWVMALTLCFFAAVGIFNEKYHTYQLLDLRVGILLFVTTLTTNFWLISTPYSPNSCKPASLVSVSLVCFYSASVLFRRIGASVVVPVVFSAFGVCIASSYIASAA